MDIVKSIFNFIAILSVLVIVHEWGHFIVAKLCGMRVEDFSLFFGKRLIRLGERNGTEYNIRSVPLGGFVRIAGMEPDDISNGSPLFRRKSAARRSFPKTLSGLTEEHLADINFDNVSDRIGEAVEQSVGEDARLTYDGKRELQTLLAGASINADEHRYLEAVLNTEHYVPDPDGYNQKPLWQRAAVIFAGPFMSLFFGYVLFCGMGLTVGIPDFEKPSNVIGAVIKDKAADKAGLRAGDKIVEINGSPITDGDAMVNTIRNYPNRSLTLVAERDKVRKTYTLTPSAEEAEIEENGKKVKKVIGRIGIQPSIAWTTYGPVEAVKHGTEFIAFQITGTFSALFSKHVSENVGGPIAIASAIHYASQEGARQLFLTAALLSVSLGILNLFPIPILDGGHLLLLAVEGIRRRKLSSREVYTAQMVGLSIIGMLFVLVMYNDIHHLFMGRGRP